MKNICFQMTRKGWFLAFVMLCLAFPAFAQKSAVTGTVVDPEGEPLIGASVLAEGTSEGVATDFDGNFSINVAPNAVLVVSYVGYDTQRVSVDGRKHIDITLKENSVMLNEVVAIGYGVVKKSDATGSVSVIKPDDIEAGISVSTQDLLVGAAPGVVVTTDGGSPAGNGTIRIRGGSSLNASNDPLIVIDGVPQSNQDNAGGANALTMINPQTIESITVLKDASATAIYGSRASNGVIIVTTKKGMSGKPQVNFSANLSVQTPRKYYDVMSASEFEKVVREQIGTETAIGMLGNGSTDWQKEVLRTTFSQDYNLSIGGAAKWLPYRVTVGYTGNNGVLKTTSMDRTNVAVNLSPKFFNDHLTVNANVSGTYIRSREADWVTNAALRMDPTQPVYTAYNTVGSYGRPVFNGYTNYVQDAGSPNTLTAQNPLQQLEDRNNVGKVYSSTGNLQLDYALHFLPELHFNLNLGYQVSKNTRNTAIAENSIMAWRNAGLSQMGSAGAATLEKWYELQRNTLLDFYINYRKEFDAIKSNLDVMAGYSWQHFDYHGRSNNYVNGLGFQTNNGMMIYNDGVYTLDYDQASGANIGKPVNNAPMSRWGQELQLISFFGRLNYSFNDTYLLTFTLRDDATSRFSKDSRWGLFPSVALAWKINNMPFMESTQGWLNDFKLRLGWGITGQQDVNSYFPYLPYYSSSYQQGFLYLDPSGSGQWINPLYPESYDANIKWEETTTWSAGIDMAMLNNRITFTLDWYLRDTNDLLAETIVSGWNTKDKVLTNIGSLRNYGLEATITARPVATRDFTWTTSYNIGWNRNKITKLTGDVETSRIGARKIPAGTDGFLQYHLVGESAFSFMVFQQVYDSNGDPIPGQYVDQNADGVIDNDDKIVYHSPEPKVTMTWNNTFNYKNWDFGISLRASLGNYMYNNQTYQGTRLSAVSAYTLNNLLADRFLFPADLVDQNLALSSYFVEDASFLRCDNITVGYTWDNLFNNALRLRLFGAVQNPFVITKYHGVDPEKFDGIDDSYYPRPITATLGVVATF